MRSKFKWIFTLLVALTMQLSFAQEKTVKGVVTDASGAMPGVNVVVKGTQRGVSTGFDGAYSIKASQGEVLVFSFMGMNDILRTVDASGVINVKMQDEVKSLGEVVVTGAVGIKRVQNATTSSQQLVKAKELTQAGSPNVIQSLAGKVSGLQINNTGNGVKSDNKITLRGSRSMSGNNEALIVIDNAISTASILGQIPPDNIENVTVIKGAQGAALYGSDGVNGVIIVTTKKGNKSDKMTVSVNSSVDFESISYIAERQTRYGQGWSGGHVSYENGAWGAEFDGSIKPVGLAQADGSYVMAPYSGIEDNIKKFFKTGTIFQNGISISGGTADTGYISFSANRQNTDFVVDGDKLNRNSFIVKGGKKLGKFTVDATVNYISESTKTTTSRLLSELYQAATNIPVELFENSGNEGAWTSYYRNPYWMKENIRFEDNSDIMGGIIALNYAFNKNINLNYTGNVRFNQINDFYFRNGYVDNNKVGGGDHSTVSQFDQSNSSRRNYYGDLMLNFDYNLTEKLSFKLNLGQNVQDDLYKITSQGGDNLTVPGFYNIGNITGDPRYATNYSTAATAGYNNEKFGLANGTRRFRKVGVFANVDLAYNNFIFLNLTGRNDWDSRLKGTSKESYFYPSAGLSIVPTKLESLKDGKILSYAKFAASYTKVGNIPGNLVGPYAVNQLYGLGSGFPYGGQGSFVQFSNPTDNDIKPEFVSTIELNASFGFLKDRITLDGSAYKGVTTDLITDISTSSASGFSSIKANVGQMTTKGFEIDLGFTPIKTDNFKWENRLSYSTYKSIVDKVSDQSKEVELQQLNGEVGVYAVEGEEFPLIKGTAYERDPQGRVVIDATTGNPVRASKFQTLGKSTPDYIINYNTAFEYKGLRFAAVFDYRTGHQFYSETFFTKNEIQK